MTPANPHPGTGLSVSRRGLLLGGTLTAAALLAPAAVDSAPAVAAARTAPTFDIDLTGTGFTAPARLTAGPATFRVTTAQQGGRSLLLIQLFAGVSLAQFLDHLRQTQSNDPAQKAAAARALEADGRNLGGAVLTAGARVGFTQNFAPGIYYLVQYNYTDPSSAPVAVKLTVVPGPRLCGPRHDDRILHRRHGDGVTFEVSQGLAATGTHRVANTTAVRNEAVLSPMAPGATREDVAAYFAALAAGQAPPATPVTAMPVGMAPLSGGVSALLHTELPPGRYLLYSYAVNSVTGRPRAFEGLYTIRELG